MPLSAKNVATLHEEQKLLTAIEDVVNSVNGTTSESAKSSLQLAKGMWVRLVCLEVTTTKGNGDSGGFKTPSKKTMAKRADNDGGEGLLFFV